MHVRACRCKNAVLRRCLGLNACVGAAGLGCWSGSWRGSVVLVLATQAGGGREGEWTEGMAPGW